MEDIWSVILKSSEALDWPQWVTIFAHLCSWALYKYAYLWTPIGARLVGLYRRKIAKVSCGFVGRTILWWIPFESEAMNQILKWARMWFISVWIWTFYAIWDFFKRLLLNYS